MLLTPADDFEPLRPYGLSEGCENDAHERRTENPIVKPDWVQGDGLEMIRARQLVTVTFIEDYPGWTVTFEAEATTLSLRNLHG